MVVVHEKEKFKYIPKQLERITIKYGNGIKIGNSIYLPKKTFYGESIPASAILNPSLVDTIKKGIHEVHDSRAGITTKTEEGKGVEIIDNISKEAADRILRKGKGFYYENL